MAAPVGYSNPSLTPTDVDSRRRMAQALYGQATDASPVGHWTQALARVLQGGVSGYYDGTASKGEKEGIASRGAFMQQAMKDPSGAAASGITNPWTTDQAGAIGQKVIGQKLEQSDPMYQLRRQQAQADLDMVPLRRQAMQADIAGKGLSQQVTQAQLEQAKMQTPQWRMENAETFGIQKGTPEWRAFVVNGSVPATDANKPIIKEVGGKLVSVTPDGRTATEIYSGSQAGVADKIAGSLNELATIPQRYDSFQNAVGSFQGSETPVISNIARGIGSVASTFSKTSPSEVRRAIDGTSETLAATIKDLIRKPGEGTWTDADQKRLDYIVGDLKRANNVTEYNRGLQEVRRRVEASFGIKLPPLQLPAEPKQQGQAPAQQMPRIQGEQDYQALPSGTQYMAPDGSVRTKR